MFAGYGGFPFSSHFEDFADFDNFSKGRTRRPTTYRYYDALGVSRDATSAEIRKAFQHLARRLHPDKGGDPEKFKQLNEAYEVLKDENKRRHYDLVGDDGSDGDCRLSHEGTVDDLLHELMGMQRGPQCRYKNHCRRQRGVDMKKTVHVRLEDIYNGATQHVAINRDRKCVGCEATGFKDGARRNCLDCNGRGVQVIAMQYGPGVFQEVQSSCDVCGGSGLDSNPRNYCELCCGSGSIKENKILDVYIEQGMSEKEIIKYPGEASCSNPLLQPGDVIVRVMTEQHPLFKRMHADLIHTARIGLFESLCGVDFSLQHLDGRSLKIQSCPGEVIRPGQVKCIEGEGMPVHGRPSLRGHLYIQFEVEYPKYISPMQQEAVRSLLQGNSTTKREIIGESVNTRDVQSLEEELAARKQFGQECSTAYDSDNSEETGSPRRHVQCSQQ